MRGQTMAVFDFNQTKKDTVKAEKTYELVYTSEKISDATHPIMILEDASKKLVHHSNGMFLAPTKGTAFVYDEEGEESSHDIKKLDARFENLMKWLGENRNFYRKTFFLIWHMRRILQSA